ncbi:MAG TPA: FG-GAP-like repeat-containing protein, partial [Myxococcota bacterium]|nr:FG-GAP-like repeat-containing protein [Myxococcota bacterium]
MRPLLLLLVACHPPSAPDAGADTAAALPWPALGPPTDEELAVLDELGPSTDLDHNGFPDACARAGSGLRCQLSDGSTFPLLVSGTLFSDASGWTDPSNYRTIRYGDVNGDGLADVCARQDTGMRCWASLGLSWSNTAMVGPAWSDARGWNNASLYSTIRMVDIDGDGLQDLCSLDGAALVCARSTGAGFRAEEALAGLDWIVPDAPAEWGSFTMGDIDGNGLVDFCMLNTSAVSPGLACWLQDAPLQFNPDIFTGGGWTPANGWSGADQWSTIRFDTRGDGNGGRLLGRGPNGIEEARVSYGVVEIYTSVVLSAYTDAQGYTDVSNYATMRVGDIDADGLGDLCIRTDAGVRCHVALRNGDFSASAITGPAWSDAAGWSAADKYMTLRLADMDQDGRQDLCGRAADGWRCAKSTGTGFAPDALGVTWSDASGWNTADHYATMHIEGSIPDRDGDAVYDRFDGCPDDRGKTAPGVCGCGVADANNDGDAAPNCVDGCPYDPAKVEPGQCGCLVPDTDGDGDGAADCVDACPADPGKAAPGVCGCGVSDADGDGDGTPDCVDACPLDPGKTAPGACGCGVVDDVDGDGFADCLPCGDGQRDPAAEACDDGGHVAGDGCSPTCALESLRVIGFAPGTAGVSNTVTVGGANPGSGV